ncbi:MAG: amino acid ABC transporter permease [Bacillota bacterium]
MLQENKKLNIILTIIFYVVFLLFINYRFSDYTYNWDFINVYFPIIIKGWGQTLLLTIVSLAFSLIIGLVLYFMKQSRILFLNYIGKVFTEVMFGTPLLVLVVILYYIVGRAFNINDKFIAAIIILTSYNSAYISEIYRSGIESIPDSQWKAAKVFGFSEYQTYRFIILPQIIKTILPPLTGQLALLVKSTALLSYMAVNEFFNTMMGVNSNTFDTIEGYIVLAIGYLIITIPISLAIKKMERRLKVTQ